MNRSTPLTFKFRMIRSPCVRPRRATARVRAYPTNVSRGGVKGTRDHVLSSSTMKSMASSERHERMILTPASFEAACQTRSSSTPRRSFKENMHDVHVPSGAQGGVVPARGAERLSWMTRPPGATIHTVTPAPNASACTPFSPTPEGYARMTVPSTKCVDRSSCPAQPASSSSRADTRRQRPHAVPRRNRLSMVVHLPKGPETSRQRSRPRTASGPVLPKTGAPVRSTRGCRRRRVGWRDMDGPVPPGRARAVTGRPVARR